MQVLLRVWIRLRRVMKVLVTKDPGLVARGALIRVPILQGRQVLLFPPKAEQVVEKEVVPVDEWKGSGELVRSNVCHEPGRTVAAFHCYERDRSMRDRGVDNIADQLRELVRGVRPLRGRVERAVEEPEPAHSAPLRLRSLGFEEKTA